MAKKRKASSAREKSSRSHETTHFTPEETFNDSEDEFFAGRDKILLDEEPAAKRRRKLEEQERALQPSDEEVYQDAEEDAEDEDEAREQLAEDEDETNWGDSKADYYNADVIETEADALEEEQEARRLQQKQLQSMTEADFGFDESAWADHDQANEQRPTVEKLPDLQIAETATAAKRTKILTSRYPELEPLMKDFLTLQDAHQQLKREAQTGKSGEDAVIRLRALSAYLGTIAMYFVLLTSSKTGVSLSPGELREHPVMTSLLRCRQLWQDAESLQPIEMPVEEKAESAPQPVPVDEPKLPKPKKQKKPRLPSPDLSPEPPTTNKPKKAKKSKRNDLKELLDASLKNTAQDESDFGDEDPLTHEEAAEKAKRKKSLRFYTSQIVQKANKRGQASRQAGGDDDLPYKERNRDKQERLMREAEQRARTQANDDEALGLDDDSDPGRNMNDDDNEYYDMLVSNSKQKKADKIARAEAYAEAARQGAQVFEEEQVGADGKRKITYAIEKNKGLQPKRKKDVRNPRVKKRKKYDEKMKKLGSIRQVYKGGEGRGGYGGEATGIKANLVKSIKL